VFIDRDFKVRGYQKVDYELPKNKETSSSQKSDDDLFDNLIMEGNYLEWKPKLSNVMKTKEPEMTLKDIYDEFWELIEENNEEFREFIVNDKRRENLKTENFL